MIKPLISIINVVLILFIFSACGQKEPVSQETTSESENKLQIMTTLFPLEDFAKRIGGEHVEVQSIMPPGTDAHTFEPTAKTMMQLSDSDIFLYLGGGMEGFAESAVKTLEDGDVHTVEASEGVTFEPSKSDQGHEHEEAEEKHHQEDEEHHDDKHKSKEEDAHADGDLDPHVWLDPLKAIQLAETVKTHLVKAKPEAKEDFERNYKTLEKKLSQLEQSFQDMASNAERKEILVSHAAYGYWERYGIEQISVSGLSPTNEPTQQQMTHILEETKEHDLQYILFEQNVRTKPAEMIKNQLNLDILYLHNLSVLTEEDIAHNEDYFSLMERNITTLQKALNK